MINPAKILPGEAAGFAGEVRSLLDQLGSPESEVSLAGVFPELQTILSAEELRTFLAGYQTRLLLPVELPAIRQAYLYASQNQCRELMALDQRLATEPRLEKFASASKRVGAVHLAHLRPLRDHRFVQRYLNAIESGEAHGWHTLVYGVILTVFSLPLRQGLFAYAEQTLKGFVDASNRRLHFSPEDRERLITKTWAASHVEIERLLATGAVVASC